MTRHASLHCERAGIQWACVLLWLLLPTVSHGAWRLVYETNLIGDPPLGRPVSVTLDPVTLELCVTDEASGTLNVFDDAGHHRFRTDAKSVLATPNGGSFDSKGGFVFTDDTEGGRTIRRLNFLGEPQPYDPFVPCENWAPQQLAVTRDGHFLTLDRSALLVRHDGADGRLVWERRLDIASAERSDLLGRPAEAPDGSIYIPNSGEGVINVVSADGKSSHSFGRRGVKPGELAFPVGVAFGPGGLVLVLDQMKHKVILFDSEHEFVAEFGGVGARPGDFYNPVAITAKPDGRVYVAQGFEGRIQVFRLLDVAEK